MAFHPQSNPQQLAEFFRRTQEEVICEWRQQAGVLLAELKLDQPTLTDHVPDVIAEITRDLALQREGDLSVEHTRGSPPAHGVQRFHDGLDVGEVIAEYNLLRGAFFIVAERHQLSVAGEAARIIHHRIDESVRMAAMAFAAQQTLIRQAQNDEHLAFIAHDLRTPLNAVSLLVEELQYSLAPTALAEAGDLFESLGRNLHKLEALIRRVLEASAPATGNGTSFAPQRRTFDLWPLVQRLLFDLRSVAAKSDVRILNQIPPALSVYGDAGLLSHVFQNLLSNAFKYSAHGCVLIGAREDAGTVTCTVSDNGAGIPRELLPRVFDKLTTDSEKGGTGLGLVIVEQIIEAHGGTVKAESVLGEGATFTFTLPPPAQST